MPVPSEYQRASLDFDKFMVDARDISGLATTNTDEPRLPFGDRVEMIKEVQALRAAHNFAPDTAIHDVATALRRNINDEDLDRVLAELPEDAAAFWHV